METTVTHSPLGCYDFMHSKHKSESYRFLFDRNDMENKTVTFDYDEENAPELDVHSFSVRDLIEELSTFESKKYLFSTSYNSIGTKSHDERIQIARELAEVNLLDDLQVHRKRLFNRKNHLDKQINKVIVEIKVLDQEVCDLKDEEG